MKTKIAIFFLCIAFFSSCKDDEPTFTNHEGQIEYNTDSPDRFPGYPEVNILYSQFSLYENIMQTIIDNEEVARQQIRITEIKLKSGVLIPDGLSDEGFMKLKSGNFNVIEKVGTGINTIRNNIEIGVLDLVNSSKTELNFQPEDVNILAYLDSRYGGSYTSFRNNFEFNSTIEPKLKFLYFQNIYSYKYKIEK